MLVVMANSPTSAAAISSHNHARTPDPLEVEPARATDTRVEPGEPIGEEDEPFDVLTNKLLDAPELWGT